MIIYDSIIKDLQALLASYDVKHLTPTEGLSEGKKDGIIFKSDVAFELGAGNLQGVNGIAYGNLSTENEIWLIGDDLNEIKRDVPYARFVLVGVDDEALGTGHDLYRSLRKIDYTSYHLTPEGMMFRISPLSKKESVVVSKKIDKKNLSFAKLGAYVIDKYRQVDGVKSVKVLFVTLPTFDFDSLKKLGTHAEDITTALDHLLGKVKMDCNSCKLQPVCNEVEELCKGDF